MTTSDSTIDATRVALLSEIYGAAQDLRKALRRARNAADRSLDAMDRGRTPALSANLYTDLVRAQGILDGLLMLARFVNVNEDALERALRVETS